MPAYEVRVWQGELATKWHDETEQEWISRMTTNPRYLFSDRERAARREVRDLV